MNGEKGKGTAGKGEEKNKNKRRIGQKKGRR